MQGQLVLLLGDETGISSYWFIPAYTTGSALGFLIAGANSDLFGRRMFLFVGHHNPMRIKETTNMRKGFMAK
jgi:MFS family permease